MDPPMDSLRYFSWLGNQTMFAERSENVQAWHGVAGLARTSGLGHRRAVPSGIHGRPVCKKLISLVLLHELPESIVAKLPATKHRQLPEQGPNTCDAMRRESKNTCHLADARLEFLHKPPPENRLLLGHPLQSAEESLPPSLLIAISTSTAV